MPDFRYPHDEPELERDDNYGCVMVVAWGFALLLLVYLFL